jgi:hypothetical protein
MGLDNIPIEPNDDYFDESIVNEESEFVDGCIFHPVSDDDIQI